MLAFKPRIFHKGLVLLVVPLLFELIIAASLIYLQHYYEESVTAEALRKQIVFHINEFWFHSVGVTTTRLVKVFVKDFKFEFDTNSLTLAEYSTLTKLLAGDSQQLKRLEEIIDSYYRCRAISDELNPAAGDTSGPLAQMLALKSNLKVCKRLLAANLETVALIRSFREYELTQTVRTAEQVGHVALLIQLVLAGAIAGNAVIAFILFGYFMRGIHAGIQTLLQNIKRFKNGEQLAPAIAGTDEIAVLDARFHEMAKEVALAQSMKQAFISTMSREFRDPIASTMEYLMKLSEGCDAGVSERGRVRAQQAEQALHRLIVLMNDLLALESSGSSCIKVEPRRCSLAEIVQSAIHTVSGLAEMNGISLVDSIEQTEAYADPDRIVQVLVNLLSNAIKFSPPGSAVVVSTHKLNDQVEVRVADKGRGVPAHLREAIFERFQQVAAADATEKGGTGLGLPICKEIVELHGGTIGVESEEGEGSTFWFRLPVSGETNE